MRLAWYNITHDRMRFAVTVLGITCAVFLMIFQGSILLGFLRAASKIIDSTDADIWITGRGVQCFEFAVPIERRFADLARGVRGVSGTSRICTSLVQFRKIDGSQQQVALIGADPNSGARLPIPRLAGNGRVSPEALVVDSSNTDARHSLPPCRWKLKSTINAPAWWAELPDSARFSAVPTFSLLIRMHRAICGCVRTKPCSSWCTCSRDSQLNE